MPAFKPAEIEVLQKNLEVLKTRMFITNTCALTGHDIVDLFAPADDRELLKNARLVANTESAHGSFQFAHEGRKLHVSMCRTDRPLLPLHPSLQGDAPAHLVETFTSWVTQQFELAIGFGRAGCVLKTLNDYCMNTQQMRYLWPASATIASANLEAGAGVLAEKLGTFKKPSTVPAIPAGLRLACKSTAGLITMAGLLPKDLKAPSYEVAGYIRSDSKTTEPDLGEFTFGTP